MLDEYRRRRDQLLRPGSPTSRASAASSRRARSTCSSTSRTSCRRTACARRRSSRSRCSTSARVALTPARRSTRQGSCASRTRRRSSELREGVDATIQIAIDRARSIASRRAERTSALSRAPCDRLPPRRRPPVLDALGRASARTSSATDDGRAQTYGTDALKRGHPADVVVLPAQHRRGRGGCARSAPTQRMPLVPRGGGHRLHRRRGAGARRRRAVASSG